MGVRLNISELMGNSSVAWRKRVCRMRVRPQGAEVLKTFTVSITVQLNVMAKDVNEAENIALDIVEEHLYQMLDCPNVRETWLTLSATNPRSKYS